MKQSFGKGKIQQALSKCVRCITWRLECELRLGKSILYMRCIEAKAKYEWDGMEGGGKWKRHAEGGSPREKIKKMRLKA